MNLLKKILSVNPKIKIITIILIIIALFFIFKGKGKTINPEFVEVKRNNISSKIDGSGILSGKTVSTLHFLSSGKLNYLSVKNGDKVTKGQTIAALDSTQLNSTLQQALNTRRNTQAAVDNVHDQVKDHSSDETFSQKATRTAAEVANDNAYDAVLSAQKAIRDATITAPFAGIIVGQNDINIGQNISAADVIAKVVDFSLKVFEATIDESDIGSVKIGQDAQITLNAYGETIFNGKVIEIDSQTQTESTGSITVTVKIQIDDPRINPIYGLNGQASIITNSKENVLTINQDALVDDNHVYIKNQLGKPELKEITIGIKSDTDVEILSGLSQNDQVVSNPITLSATK